MDDAIDWAEVLLKRTFTKGRTKGGVGGQTIDEMMRGTFHEVSAFELEGAAADYTALRARLAEVEKERDDALEDLQGAQGQIADAQSAIARAERAETALATARRDALEEAAGLTPYDCDGHPAGQFDNHVFVKRDAIRALIAQEDAQREAGE